MSLETTTKRRDRIRITDSNRELIPEIGCSIGERTLARGSQNTWNKQVKHSRRALRTRIERRRK